MGRVALSVSTLSKAIDKKLAKTPINAEERSIFKVHEQLLKVNEKAYEPVLLAIGPYNDHGKVGQGLMEEHKLQYLKQMLQRRNERSEERARNCYAECISLKKYEFVEMMLLDGRFIIELFHKCEGSSPMDDHDPIFQLDWMLPKITHDLPLFENQLPFFVLTRLFLMIESSQTPLPKLLRAKKCQEVGVKLKKEEIFKHFNGVLEISPLRIGDETETFLQNLIAYEQNDPYKVSNYVTDYMCFMDDLIDSPKDVELLRRKGIIENWLGEDEVVSTMVNKLGHHVFFSPNNIIYAKTSIDMNKHCAKRWNVWMAKLRHKYFNSPWALLSVLAAIILLGLAITQTVFSIIH
ncbi:hypothetical protein I3843_01G117900 [Carya illinoinensis]|nr:hypothetical protein I3843_01G117900 [Carya illinoinensis]